MRPEITYNCLQASLANYYTSQVNYDLPNYYTTLYAQNIMPFKLPKTLHKAIYSKL